MQKQNAIAVAAVLLWSCLSAAARGDVLASYTITVVNFGFDNRQYFPYAVFPVEATAPNQPPNAPPVGYALFNSFHWTNGDVGSTITETPATSSDAAGAIALLADGINEDVLFKVRNEGGADGGFAWSSEGAYPVTEANAFFPTGGGPDFGRFAITDVRETLNSMTLSTPISGNATTHATYTVTVDGTVPEPGAAAMLSLTVGMACLRRPRQGQRSSFTHIE